MLSVARALVGCPADLQTLLDMLVRLEEHESCWRPMAWSDLGVEVMWAPFCSAMRHLQQHHVLDADALAPVHRGFKALAAAVMVLQSNGLHAIHCLALRRTEHALPLQLLLLLGVPVDLMGFPAEGGRHGWDKGLREEVGACATALAMSFSTCLKWTEEDQKQRLPLVQGLVAAGASYKWVGEHGTILSMSAFLSNHQFLQTLLARPNALAEFSRKEVSAAFLMAAAHNMWLNGSLLLEAGAKHGNPAAAAKLVGWAVQNSNLKALRRLLAAGAQPNARMLGSNHMPLHEVVIKADVKGSNMVSRLDLCMQSTHQCAGVC